MTGRGRKKGIAKPPGSGRQKGVTNLVPSRAAISETVAQTLGRLGFDLVEEMIKLLPALLPEVRLKAMATLLPYIAAPMKTPETPAQPAFQVFANIDRASLLQAVNMPLPSIEPSRD